MARTKNFTLKQLKTALRSLSIAEFMNLSRGGRIAYGTLFDELAEDDDVVDDAPQLAAPASTKALPRPPSGQSIFPTGHTPVPPPPGQPSMPPRTSHWRRLQPLQAGQDMGPWVDSLVGAGVDRELAKDALEGLRPIWAKGDVLELMRQFGFTFEEFTIPRVEPAANVGSDLFVG